MSAKEKKLFLQNVSWLFCKNSIRNFRWRLVVRLIKEEKNIKGIWFQIAYQMVVSLCFTCKEETKLIKNKVETIDTFWGLAYKC